MNKEKYQELVTVDSFESTPEANIYKSYLESYDIECFLLNEDIVNMHWGLSNAYGGVKLQVSSENFDKASDLVSELRKKNKAKKGDLEKFKGQRNNCPYCESDNINVSFFSTGALILTILLFGIPLLFIDRKGHCYECDKNWKT